MQNPLLWFIQSSIISEEPAYFSGKLKILTDPPTVEFNSFCWNFAQLSDVPASIKECSGFFWFCLDLELLVNLISVSV